MSNFNVLLSKKDDLKHLFDGTDCNVYDEKFINLCVGAPGPDLLKKCCDLLKKATDHRMNAENEEGAYVFQYSATIGNDEPRNTIAKFLSQAYRETVLKHDLVLSSGASSGLHLILSVLLDLNGVIFVDEATYHCAIECFKQFPTMKIISVKLTESGVDSIDLEKVLKEHIRKPMEGKMFWGMYYTIPTYHNPTGILFSEDVCKKIIALARKYDILVVSDDVYNFLYYNTTVGPKRLFAYDRSNELNYKGHVISNGSFSKTIAPGIRLGWLECPPRCVEVLNRCGVLISGGCPGNYMATIVQSALELGLVQEHIKFVTNAYKSRMLAVCDELKRELPKGCSFKNPDGGYFIWICLSKDTDAAELNRFCKEKYKISIMPGVIFSVKGELTNCFRISIGFLQKDVLIQAVRNLCAAIKEFLILN